MIMLFEISASQVWSCIRTPVQLPEGLSRTMPPSRRRTLEAAYRRLRVPGDLGGGEPPATTAQPV